MIKIKQLEFDKILSQLSTFVHSKKAKLKAEGIMPQNDFSAATTLMQETEIADIILYEHSVSPAFSINDLEDILPKARKLSTLGCKEIMAVGVNLHVAAKLKESFNVVETDARVKLLGDRLEQIYCDASLENDISKAFISENEVADSASSLLKELRKEIKIINERIRTKLNSYISNSSHQKYLQDNLVTIRNNRYVLPIKSEYRSAVKGLVHDQSASGATLYIEPLEIVSLNNELKERTLDELREVEKILKEFTVRISSIADLLENNDEVISDFDVIFAKAKYAASIKAIKPALNDKGKIDIVEGRHPLIDSQVVVAVSISLGSDYDVLLITGPNTGGKTVTLKMTGLFACMAMSGMFLPCEKADISVFDNIFVDIGDEQSIEQSLSTFSSHIVNIIQIIDNINDKSLALIDELGAGTDPEEGSALAQAVLDYILKSKARAIITSHYGELKEFSFRTERIENASMGFDNHTFKPTYKLLCGIAGSSNALAISRRLGLKSEIVDKAEGLVSQWKKDFENVLRSAEQSRSDAEQVKREIAEEKVNIARLKAEAEQDREIIRQKREKLEADMKKQASVLLADYTEEAQEILEKIKAILNEPTEQNLFEARRLNKKLERLSYDKEEDVVEKFSDEPIAVGDEVFVPALNGKAVVVSINNKNNEVKVKAGVIETIVKSSDLKKMAQHSKANKDFVKSNVSFKRDLNTAVTTEVNLIGQNVDEALFNLDDFLDKAISSGVELIRIVHGKGKGILRKAIQKHLAANPAVDEYRDGKYGEGENGVTIVKLK